MHHEPIRATRNKSGRGQYLTAEGVIIPDRDLTEAEWQGYSAEVRKAVRDGGLHDVLADDDVKAQRHDVDASAEDAPLSSAEATSSGGRRAGAGAGGGVAAKRGEGDK